MKKIKFIGILLLLMVAGCNHTETLKIGFIGPLTGEVAMYGINPQKGALLAIEEINAGGGINGKLLELVSEDSTCDPATGLTTLNKLIDSGVEFIIGPVCSSVTLASAPTAEERQVILISPASTNYQITNAGEYIFRTVPSDAAQGVKGAETAIEYGRTAAVMFVEDNDYGVGLKDVFEKRFKELGGEVSMPESHLIGDSDFKTILAKVEGADILYLPTSTKEAGRIVKQAKELGLEFQIIGTETMQDPEFLNIAGESAEGVLFTSFSEYEGAGTVRFQSSFLEKYGEEKGIYSDYGYDAMIAIRKAAEICPELKSSCVKESLYTIDFTGATGKVSFDMNGDAEGKEFSIFEFSNGQIREH